jgi:hypothetical protein
MSVMQLTDEEMDPDISFAQFLPPRYEDRRQKTIFVYIIRNRIIFFSSCMYGRAYNRNKSSICLVAYGMDRNEVL